MWIGREQSMSETVACLVSCLSVVNLLCPTCALMFSLSLSRCVSSSWAVTSPAPSSSRWQSRPTGSPLAQWQGVRVTPHWLPAFFTPPPTYLLACIPAPPPSAVLMRKGWERGQWFLYCPFPCLQEHWLLPCLKRSSLALFFSLYLLPALLSLGLALSCLSPLCVPWENPPVWILLYLCEWSEEGGWGWGWRVVPRPSVWLQTPHCFSYPPPFLHFSSFYPKGDSLIRRYGSVIPSSLSVSL